MCEPELMHTNTQMNTITIIKTTVIFCQLSIRMLKAIGAAAAVSRIKCNSMNPNKIYKFKPKKEENLIRKTIDLK